MMAESEVMDVDWIEDPGVTAEQNGKSATELQIENELSIDRWIDIAYDENGDEIADDKLEMLQVQEAMDIGLQCYRKAPKETLKNAIREFACKYGLLGLMTALPTTVHFADFKQVYLLKNQFIREEAMDTLEYLKLFFPFEMPAFAKGEKGHVLNLTDRTMIALAMTFRTDPQAMVMPFMRNYGERYDWLVEVFRDLAFTFMAAFLYYHDKDSTDETTLDLYRQGMAAFDGNAPTYHIELRDKPTIVWDFHSLLMGIKMVLSIKLTDDRYPRANAHKTD